MALSAAKRWLLKNIPIWVSLSALETAIAPVAATTISNAPHTARLHLNKHNATESPKSVVIPPSITKLAIDRARHSPVDIHTLEITRG